MQSQACTKKHIALNSSACASGGRRGINTPATGAAPLPVLMCCPKSTVALTVTWFRLCLNALIPKRTGLPVELAAACCVPDTGTAS